MQPGFELNRPDDAVDADLHIFSTLMQGTLWRPADSGRQIVLDWLQDIATNTLAVCQSSNKQERREKFRQGLAEESLDNEKHPCKTIKNPDSSPYSFRLWPDKVQALVTYDAMRLNDPTLPFLVRTGRYMPAGLHTPRLTVVAVKDLRERSFPGCFAYFMAEPHEQGPVFFDGLPPKSFTGARQKSIHYTEQRKRICSQLQARARIGGFCTQMGALQVLADIFSDHELFLRGELHPFLEKSSSLKDAPSFGIIDGPFLRHMMSQIQRWPDLDDCREAIKEEQHKLCAYIETIRFEATDGLIDSLPRLGATYLAKRDE